MPKIENSNILERINLLSDFATRWKSEIWDESGQFVPDMRTIISSAKAQNQWFNPEEIERALNGILALLSEKSLNELHQHWKGLGEPDPAFKQVGVIAAGNIPLVCFHDVLMCFFLGVECQVKLSSQDTILVSWLLARFKDLTGKTLATPVGRLNNMDAVIATGSNNSARYFEAYFGKHPHIIRKNRTSVAIVDADTTSEELRALSEDVFAYFGMGCRNVSHIFMPKGQSLDPLFEAFFHQGNYMMSHNKYMNNFDYHRAVYLMEKKPFLENNFAIIREHDDLFSPVGVTHVSRYENKSEVVQKLLQHTDDIQCVVGKGYVPFGKAQYPGILDFADGVDTVAFLTQES